VGNNNDTNNKFLLPSQWYHDKSHKELIDNLRISYPMSRWELKSIKGRSLIQYKQTLVLKKRTRHVVNLNLKYTIHFSIKTLASIKGRKSKSYNISIISYFRSITLLFITYKTSASNFKFNENNISTNVTKLLSMDSFSLYLMWLELTIYILN
jgi:hypothetical protein